MRAPSRTSLRGFTLVELMAVVVITSVLATIGVAAFRRQVYGSKTTEALAMIQSIRAAQERWKAENLRYLNVSTEGTWYPAAPVPRTKRAFYDSTTCSWPNPDPSQSCRWKLLNPTITGPVEFGYMVNAGAPSETMTAPDALARPLGWSSWSSDGKSPTGEHWYVVQAIGDSDGDGKYSKFLASSIRGDVYQELDN